jgi:hypothetical protein
MQINIDQLSEAVLIELNHKIEERLTKELVRRRVKQG